MNMIDDEDDLKHSEQIRKILLHCGHNSNGIFWLIEKIFHHSNPRSGLNFFSLQNCTLFSNCNANLADERRKVCGFVENVRLHRSFGSDFIWMKSSRPLTRSFVSYFVMKLCCIFFLILVDGEGKKLWIIVSYGGVFFLYFSKSSSNKRCSRKAAVMEALSLIWRGAKASSVPSFKKSSAKNHQSVHWHITDRKQSTLCDIRIGPQHNEWNRGELP